MHSETMKYKAEVLLHYADYTPTPFSFIPCVCNCFICTGSHWSVLHKSYQVSDLPVLRLWQECSFISEF